MVYVIGLGAVMVLFRILFSYKIYGREYLQEYKENGKPFVICANHRNILDPVFVLMAYGWGKKLTIMGKAELFKNPILAWIFRQFGAFPIERGTGDMQAIDKAISDIKAGHGMMIFPEGTRGQSDQMGRVKTGAFMIAAQTNADIIPVRLIYPTKTRKLKFFGPVIVKIGKPITHEEMDFESGDKRALRRAKTTYTQVMQDLLDEYNESVGYVPPVIETGKEVEGENESN